MRRRGGLCEQGEAAADGAISASLPEAEGAAQRLVAGGRAMAAGAGAAVVESDVVVGFWGKGVMRPPLMCR